MKYEPRFKDEIELIINSIEKKLEEYNFEKNLLKTESLCRCLLIAFFSLIRSSYGSLLERQLVGCRILSRSMIEYLVDLKYIANSDDEKLNSKFRNYFILVRHWRSKDIEYYKQAIPKISYEYQQYVDIAFPEITRQVLITKSGKRLKKGTFEYWQEADKHIAAKYKRNWAGITLKQKVEKIITIIGKRRYSILAKTLKDKSNTRSILSAIKKHPEYYILYEGLNSDSSKNDIIEQLGMYPNLGEIISGFDFYSGFTHSSPYGSIPHFDFRNGKFDWNYDYNDNELFDVEKYIFLILDHSVKEFGEMMLKRKDDGMLITFEKTLRKCKKILAWLSTYLKISSGEMYTPAGIILPSKFK